MANTDPIADLDAFVATGDESADLERLYSITDRIASVAEVRCALPALLGYSSGIQTPTWVRPARSFTRRNKPTSAPC
jgi:hypothetical protein